MKKLISNLFLMLISLFISAQDFSDQALNLGLIGTYGNDIHVGQGGISFADFNNDGLDDLTFCSQNGNRIQFFINKGNRFEPIVISSLSNNYETKQAVWIDYNNDGEKDLFVSTFFGPDYLYKNLGNLTFLNVTFLTGLPFLNNFTYGVNFADFNKDGYLDIYLSYYGWITDGEPNPLFIYNSQLEIYEDYTIAAQLNLKSYQSFNSVIYDYDFDGDMDIYVSNDRVGEPNEFYINNGNLTFTEIAASNNTNYEIESMNACVGDYDNDGFWDIYITNNQAAPAALFSSDGTGQFTDNTVFAGVSFDRFGWGANFLDFDNDKDLDLYACTSWNFEPNAFYVNTGFGFFNEPFLSLGGITGNDTLSSYVNAIGDINFDGKPDIAVLKGFFHNYSMYLNEENNNNLCLKLDLEGVLSNRDAIGAVVEVWENGSKRMFQKHCSNGYLSQHSDYLNIGLGTNFGVDSLVIKWPFFNSEDVIYNTDLVLGVINKITEGVGITYFEPELCLSDHQVFYNPISNGQYKSIDSLYTFNEIKPFNEVNFIAQNEIILKAGFFAPKTSDFLAQIENCY